jgi:2',3'-cyclic-nucleotide 2'-phosphodiesterase
MKGIMQPLKLLFIGDVVGEPGRAMVARTIGHIKQNFSIDAIIINGENTANGKGITPAIAESFKSLGALCVTTGNHIWQNKEIFSYLDQHSFVLRPDNFSHECPGKGVAHFSLPDGTIIGVIHIQGRVFMREHINCPFKAADSALTFLKTKTNIIFVDFHAETTSEKNVLGYYLDGRVSAVVGTHTHIPTADERILPKGTAYITDVGMVGALNSALGVQLAPVTHTILTQMPAKFIVESNGPMVLNAVVITIDRISGKSLAIERIRIIDHESSAT